MRLFHGSNCKICTAIDTYSGVSSLSSMWDQYGPLQLCGTQYCPPLTKSKNGVSTFQRRLGEKTCRAVKEINHIAIEHIKQMAFSAKLYTKLLTVLKFTLMLILCDFDKTLVKRYHNSGATG